MSKKIPKIVANQLEEKARSLPNLQASDLNGNPLFKQERIGGGALLRQYPNGTDEKGNPYVAQQYYYRQIPVIVNHSNELRKAFVKDGMAGADNYCQSVRDIYEKAIKPRTRIGALMVYLKLKIMKPFLRWKHPLQEQAELLANSKK